MSRPEPILYKTNADARIDTTTDPTTAWVDWVDDRIQANNEAIVEGIGSALGDYCGQQVAPLKREIELLRRECECLRREFAALQESVGLERGLRDLRSEVDEARAQVPKVPEMMRGPPGPSGPRGEEGPPGKLPIVKLWTPETVYYAGDVVAFDGGTFQAMCDTGQPPSHTHWICLAAAGRDGKTMAVRGTFDESVSYRRLDVVALNGGSFIALKDAPGPCPGSGWLD